MEREREREIGAQGNRYFEASKGERGRCETDDERVKVFHQDYRGSRLCSPRWDERRSNNLNRSTVTTIATFFDNIAY